MHIQQQAHETLATFTDRFLEDHAKLTKTVCGISTEDIIETYARALLDSTAQGFFLARNPTTIADIKVFPDQEARRGRVMKPTPPAEENANPPKASTSAAARSKPTKPIPTPDEIDAIVGHFQKMQIKMLEGQRRPQQSSECYNCQQLGHMAYDCSALCTKCRNADHAARDCPRRNRRAVRLLEQADLF
jgi:hypothetical protein